MFSLSEDQCVLKVKIHNGKLFDTPRRSNPIKSHIKLYQAPIHYHTTLYNIIPYNMTLCQIPGQAILYITRHHMKARYNSQNHTTRHETIQYHSIPHHNTLHNTIPCYTAHHTTPNHNVPYHSISYHTIVYRTIIYHTILHHTIPKHTRS